MALPLAVDLGVVAQYCWMSAMVSSALPENGAPLAEVCAAPIVLMADRQSDRRTEQREMRRRRVVTVVRRSRPW
jgi:hypothetical protein